MIHFPTAMSIASVFVLEDRVLPALNTMIETLKSLEQKYMNVIKTGRTHLQDAVPDDLWAGNQWMAFDARARLR